jgi:hypothetical protein
MSQACVPQVLQNGRVKEPAQPEAARPGPGDAPPAVSPNPAAPFGQNFSDSVADQLHTYQYDDRHKV